MLPNLCCPTSPARSACTWCCLQLAVQEVRYGLSLLAGAAELAARPVLGTVGSVVATLMAYPREGLGVKSVSAGAGAAGAAPQQEVQLERSAVQQAVGELAAEAAKAAAAAAPAAGDSAAQRSLQERADVARMSARLRLLRVALHDAVRAAATARGAGASAPVQEAHLRLHAIFLGGLAL